MALRNLLILIITAVLCPACVSKKKAAAQAQQAFWAGQRQAAMSTQQTHLQGPTVTVLGQVRTPLVPWTLGLTLAKAVVEAGYFGFNDPVEIVIQRDGQETRYDPRSLLNGQDVLLQPNDVIVLR